MEWHIKETPQYSVLVLMQIKARYATWTSKDIVLQRELWLPFPPYAGLELHDGEWTATLKHVVWHIDSQHFECWTEPCVVDNYAIPETVDAHLEEDWKERYKR